MNVESASICVLKQYYLTGFQAEIPYGIWGNQDGRTRWFPETTSFKVEGFSSPGRIDIDLHAVASVLGFAEPCPVCKIFRCCYEQAGR